MVALGERHGRVAEVWRGHVDLGQLGDRRCVDGIETGYRPAPRTLVVDARGTDGLVEVAEDEVPGVVRTEHADRVGLGPPAIGVGSRVVGVLVGLVEMRGVGVRLSARGPDERSDTPPPAWSVERSAGLESVFGWSVDGSFGGSPLIATTAGVVHVAEVEPSGVVIAEHSDLGPYAGFAAGGVSSATVAAGGSAGTTVPGMCTHAVSSVSLTCTRTGRKPAGSSV